MSLYDDVVTDFGAANKTEIQKDIANWGNNNFKLLQLQVEAAKKRQLQLSAASSAKAKREKHANNIAPVIDLSDKRGKPQLQLRKDDVGTSSSSLNTALSLAASLANATPASLKSMPPTAELTASAASSSSSSSSQHHSSASELRFNTLTGKIEREEASYAKSVYASSSEEYDPMRPNDYEKLLDERRRMARLESKSTASRHDERKKRDRDSGGGSERRRRRSSSTSGEEKSGERRHSRDEKSSKRRSRHSSSDEDEKRRPRKHQHHEQPSAGGRRIDEAAPKRQSAAFAPPPSLIEQDIKQSSEATATDEPKPITTPPKSLYGGLLKAEKMMAKMGYREGDGLGRNKQGMSIALQVEKTGKRSGRIIHEKDVVIEPLSPVAPAVPPPSLATPQKDPGAPIIGVPNEVMRNMSKVILLKNMVGPGDVDDDLEGETKEECQKYGEVNKCIIFEMPNKPPEEAVRIFIEFKTLPSAIKALTDLNGRFFGGRIVKATFYNLDKFKRLELADDV